MSTKPEPLRPLAPASGSATGPRILTVLLEYSEERRRVIVRGAWPKAEMKMRPKLLPGNFQNYVDVFEGVDMTWHIGFAGLVPEPEPSDQSGPMHASRNATTTTKTTGMTKIPNDQALPQGGAKETHE